MKRLPKDIRQTAFHEAVHAAAAWRLGNEIEGCIDIKLHVPVVNMRSDPVNTESILIFLCAGREAEDAFNRRAGNPLGSTEPSQYDDDKIWKIIEKEVGKENHAKFTLRLKEVHEKARVLVIYDRQTWNGISALAEALISAPNNLLDAAVAKKIFRSAFDTL